MNPEDEKDIEKLLDTLMDLQENIMIRLDALVKDTQFVHVNPDYIDTKLKGLVSDIKVDVREKLKIYEEKLKKSRNHNRIANILK